MQEVVISVEIVASTTPEHQEEVVAWLDDQINKLMHAHDELNDNLIGYLGAEPIEVRVADYPDISDEAASHPVDGDPN